MHSTRSTKPHKNGALGEGVEGGSGREHTVTERTAIEIRRQCAFERLLGGRHDLRRVENARVIVGAVKLPEAVRPTLGVPSAIVAAFLQSDGLHT